MFKALRAGHKLCNPNYAPRGALTALAVELSLQGNADGETRLSLPNEWAGSDRLWQAVSDLTVDGGRLADGDDARRIVHAPGAMLTVRYRITANAPSDPDADFEKARPVIRPGWFFFHGEGVFATPAAPPAPRACRMNGVTRILG